MLVRDGQTVVLGGLRERTEEIRKSGIPLLSEIPLIGGLFGIEERQSIESELFLFITPTVLRDDASAAEAAARAFDAVERAGIKIPDKDSIP